jgi:hypothetical protein
MTDTNQSSRDAAPGGAPPDVSADLPLRIEQLQAAQAALEQENKNLRYLVESVIAHRQQSHTELVLLLTNLVSKLPMNEVGLIISKLVEHNSNVSHYLAALAKGTADVPIPEPSVLKTLDQARRDLQSAIHPLVEELVKSQTPIEPALIESLNSNPEVFFSAPAIRAWRCFVKGQVPRERIAREFGDPALKCCVDMTTDPKLNPRPKPEEIVMGFRGDFEVCLSQDTELAPERKEKLLDLFKRVQRSKSNSPEARAERTVFQKLSFFIELLHYYEHQNTEPADVMFAQRLPVLVEQLAASHEVLSDGAIRQIEDLLAHIVNTDHRQMVINNVGKGGGTTRTLKYILTMRSDKIGNPDPVAVEFVRHLIPAQSARPPAAAELSPLLRLLDPERQKAVVRALAHTDRVRKLDAEAAAKSLAAELGLASFEQAKAAEMLPPRVEREVAWSRIRDMVAHRADPASLAATIRERLSAHYESDEIRESWMVLTEADPMSFIRVFCLLPYLAGGKTDPIAKPVMETYLTRLVHEKYAGTYNRVLTSLRNIFKTKPDSPTLQTFVALCKWASPDAAGRIVADIGIHH